MFLYSRCVNGPAKWLKHHSLVYGHTWLSYLGPFHLQPVRQTPDVHQPILSVEDFGEVRSASSGPRSHHDTSAVSYRLMSRQSRCSPAALCASSLTDPTVAINCASTPIFALKFFSCPYLIAIAMFDIIYVAENASVSADYAAL